MNNISRKLNNTPLAIKLATGAAHGAGLDVVAVDAARCIGGCCRDRRDHRRTGRGFACRRYAQRHRLLPPRHLQRHPIAAPKHQGQRTGPETVRERPGLFRDVARPLRQVFGRRQMHDEGMIAGPSLGSEDAPYRRGIARVGGKAIDRLGRQPHQFAGAKPCCRLGQSLFAGG